MSCANKKTNSDFCSCTYPGCSKKGVCCECIRYHISRNEVPACFFPPEAEATYDRSLDYFLSVCKQKKA